MNAHGLILRLSSSTLANKSSASSSSPSDSSRLSMIKKKKKTQTMTDKHHTTRQTVRAHGQTHFLVFLFAAGFLVALPLAVGAGLGVALLLLLAPLLLRMLAPALLMARAFARRSFSLSIAAVILVLRPLIGLATHYDTLWERGFGAGRRVWAFDDGYGLFAMGPV